MEGQLETQVVRQVNAYPNYSPVSYLSANGMPYERQTPYSYVIKPVVMSVPEITAFDFQTEDYRDQMEVEMEWINDSERLGDDIPSVFESVNEQEYDKTETKDSQLSDTTSDSEGKSLQILPQMPANVEMINNDNTEEQVLDENKDNSDSITHKPPSNRHQRVEN